MYNKSVDTWVYWLNTSCVALGLNVALGLCPRDNIKSLCNITCVHQLPMYQLLWGAIVSLLDTPCTSWLYKFFHTKLSFGDGGGDNSRSVITQGNNRACNGIMQGGFWVKFSAWLSQCKRKSVEICGWNGKVDSFMHPTKWRNTCSMEVAPYMYFVLVLSKIYNTLPVCQRNMWLFSAPILSPLRPLRVHQL